MLLQNEKRKRGKNCLINPLLMSGRQKNYYTHKVLSLLLVLEGIFVLSCCSTPKDVSYFQDITIENIQSPESKPIKIEAGDKLTIVVKTMDPELSALFNLQIVSEPVGNGFASAISKFTVSPEGNIDFPVLGDIHVEGMTRSELAGFIKGQLMGRQLAKDPVVTVELVNAGISLLGEVNKPGKYEITKDEINILEAISMAGDLTISGKRDNIALIREGKGGIETYRLDLTNFKELTESPAYYLKQGDIIYVEPIDMRKRQTTTNGNNVLSTGFWISVASLATSIVTTIAVFIR